MSMADDIVLVSLAKDLIEITEDYNSWYNLDLCKDEYYRRITDRLSEYGVEMEDGK